MPRHQAPQIIVANVRARVQKGAESTMFGKSSYRVTVNDLKLEFAQFCSNVFFIMICAIFDVVFSGPAVDSVSYYDQSADFHEFVVGGFDPYITLVARHCLVPGLRVARDGNDWLKGPRIRGVVVGCNESAVMSGEEIDFVRRFVPRAMPSEVEFVGRLLGRCGLAIRVIVRAVHVQYVNTILGVWVDQVERIGGVFGVGW